MSVEERTNLLHGAKEYKDGIYYGCIVIKYQIVCETCVKDETMAVQRKAAEKIIGQLKKKEEEETQKTFGGNERRIGVLQIGYICTIVVCGKDTPLDLVFLTLKQIYSVFYSTFRSLVDNLNSNSTFSNEDFKSFSTTFLQIIVKSNNDTSHPDRQYRKVIKETVDTTLTTLGTIIDRKEDLNKCQNVADDLHIASTGLKDTSDKVKRYEMCKYFKSKFTIIILIAILVLAIVGVIIGLCYHFIPKARNN